MQASALRQAATRPAETVLADLQSTRGGLSDTAAAERLARFGPNQVRHRRTTAWTVLGGQLRNPLLALLLGAAAVSALTGDPTDAAIIAVIIALSVGLGFVNEYRAARAVTALHADIRYSAVVWRGGTQRSIDVTELVPGDVVALRIGAVVPADMRLLDASDLACGEAVLTGESAAAEKTVSPAPPSDSAVDLPCCAFMGTIVVRGSGVGVVVVTGGDTAFGSIAAGLGVDQTQTAFQKGLQSFSLLLVKVAAALTTSIFLINVALARPLIDALLFSLAIAIGITPQLLPAIVSVSLASGSRALARRRVLVKRLVAIEDLGNMEMLFTDKTGTLTYGRIDYESAVGPDGADATAPLLLGLLASEAAIGDGRAVGGNDLDVALADAPSSRALLAAADGPGHYQRLGVLPFDHDRQMVSVVVRGPGGAAMLVTKGAPEAVLARCSDPPADAPATVEGLFRQGARVVAVATREVQLDGDPAPRDERDLRLAGFLTFADRPKADAAPALQELRDLGVQVRVVTGDNGLVAAKVCRDLGLDVAGVLSGTDIDALDDEALTSAIPATTVFARVSPAQKARIVRLAHGHSGDVAFLGDGVNDAVALHAADVGISVDSAADVAKDAADIILLEKSLGVLAEGVREGRRIFANTIKYVLMATSSNFGNMFSAAGASLFLSYLPMLPSQLLLNNLLYDVGQLAIPTDNVDAEAVARPGAWDLRFVRRFMTIFGPVSSIFDFLTFFILLVVLGAGRTEFRTGWFVESLATQTLVIFVIRTRRAPFWRSAPSRPMLLLPVACALVGAVLPLTPLAHTLGFTPLPAAFFAILAGLTVAYLLLVDAVKRRFYARWVPVAPPGRTPIAHHHRRIRRRAARFHVWRA
jgi:P-type Mg2+ transporter